MRRSSNAAGKHRGIRAAGVMLSYAKTGSGIPGSKKTEDLSFYSKVNGKDETDWKTKVRGKLILPRR